MTRAPSTNCRNCGFGMEDSGDLKRCPNCGLELHSARSLGALPLSVAEDLQEPAFPREGRANDDTAPASEFVAAGAVLGGAVLTLLGILGGSGTVALFGVVLIFGVTGGYAIFSGSLARSWRHGISQFLLFRPGRRDDAERGDDSPPRRR